MKSENKFHRLAGLSLVLIGAFIFVAFGYFLEQKSLNGSCDFGTVYYPARLLILHQDPYLSTSSLVPLASSGYFNPNSGTPPADMAVFCVYPPTALLVMAPIALLRWHYAELVWMTLLAGSIITAALLVWIEAAQYAPVLAGLLIGFTLANSPSLLLQGNAAGLAVGLAVIGLMLVVKQRLEIVGLVCIAISICVKPHDGMFIWLFLLVAGSAFRKRAIQALFPLILFLVCSIVWVSSVSPNWRKEMQSNLVLVDGISDPGPSSSTHTVVNSAINLQTVFSIFENKPAFYNSATYLVCSVLFAWFVIAAVRKRGSPQGRWFGIAAISALAMLPVYHRHHDGRMLMLAVPACALLWTQKRAMGWAATSIVFLALAATGDFPRVILQLLEGNQAFIASSFLGKLQVVIFTRPAPLALLIMVVFFLCMYARPEARTNQKATFNSSDEERVQPA